MITEANLQGSLTLASLNMVGVEPNGRSSGHTQRDCVCVLSGGYVLLNHRHVICSLREAGKASVATKKLESSP